MVKRGRPPDVARVLKRTSRRWFSCNIRGTVVWTARGSYVAGECRQRSASAFCNTYRNTEQGVSTRPSMCLLRRSILRRLPLQCHMQSRPNYCALEGWRVASSKRIGQRGGGLWMQRSLTSSQSWHQKLHVTGILKGVHPPLLFLSTPRVITLFSRFIISPAPPFSQRYLTMSRYPFEQALCRAVQPSPSCAWTSALLV